VIRELGRGYELEGFKPYRRRTRANLLPKERALEHVRAVIVQVRVLLPREVTDADAVVDTPSVEKLVFDLRDDDLFLACRSGRIACAACAIVNADVTRRPRPHGLKHAFARPAKVFGPDGPRSDDAVVYVGGALVVTILR
jgi:hypothetical protein